MEDFNPVNFIKQVNKKINESSSKFFKDLANAPDSASTERK